MIANYFVVHSISNLKYYRVQNTTIVDGKALKIAKMIEEQIAHTMKPHNNRYNNKLIKNRK